MSSLLRGSSPPSGKPTVNEPVRSMRSEHRANPPLENLLRQQAPEKRPECHAAVHTRLVVTDRDAERTDTGEAIFRNGQ